MQDAPVFSQPVDETTIQTAKAALESRGFTVTVVDNLENAREEVIGLVPKGSRVFTSTSVTLEKTGLADILNSEEYISQRNTFIALHGQEDKKFEMRQAGAASDITVGSVHAVTETGEVLIASATGSQMPNYTYGAGHVIWVVGAQKIVKNTDEGRRRIEEYVFPLEDVRAQKAYGVGSSINQLLFYLKDPMHRVTVIFVREAVGY